VGAVILFDGRCGLCDRTVQFVLARDRRGAFRFAALESRAGRELREGLGPSGELPDSVLLLEGGALYRESAAVLRIARGLGRPWSWAAVLRVLPWGLRDGLYRFVARRRRRWFGEREACRRPRPEERERFLDGGLD